jgi:cytochrome c553
MLVILGLCASEAAHMTPAVAVTATPRITAAPESTAAAEATAVAEVPGTAEVPVTPALTTTPELTNAPDTIAARAQGCSTCHGAHGEGTADVNFPRIAGKPAGYLFNQLKNFRDGQRSYPPMNYLVAYMHDDYLQELAAYFSSQPTEQRTAVEPATAANEAGQRLATRGDPSRAIPACILCHGPHLTGIAPGIPGLIGLNSRYIAAQLVSWRVGTRHAGNPDCMHDVAARLSEVQIREVSRWLAAQPPMPPGPAAQGAWTTPLACGSQP